MILVFLLFLIVPHTFGQPNALDKKVQADATLKEARRLVRVKKRENIEKALLKYEEAGELYKEAKNKKGLAATLLGRGFASSLLNKNSDTVSFFEQALKLFVEVSDKSGQSTVLNNLGMFHYNAGDYQKALDYLQKALPLRRETGNKNGEVLTLISIGSVYNSLGEREKALGLYKEGLAKLDAIEGNGTFKVRNTASTHSNIGRTYDELGDYQKAINYHLKAIALYRQIGDKIGEAINLVNVGVAQKSLGNREEAIKLYTQSLQIQKEAGIEMFQAATLSNFGTLYLEIGKNEKAIENFETALALQRKLRIPVGEMASLSNLGKVHINKNEPQKAIEYLNKAFLISNKVKNKAYGAFVLRNLRMAWKKKGNNRVAVFYGKQEVNKFQELRRSILGLSRSVRKKYLESVADSYRELADLLIETKDYAAAEQVLRMLKEEEFFEFVRRSSSVTEDFASKLSFNEKEKKMLERFESLLTRNQESELNKFLNEEIVAKLKQKNSEKPVYDYDLLEKVKQWGADTVVLHTVLSENRYRVILTTSEKQTDAKTEISADELDKKIYIYRKALQDIQTDPRPLGKELYDILIKPIEKELVKANAKTLVWSLDGTLRYLPISTLSPDGKTYLVEKYQNVSITPKTRDDISNIDNEWRALGVGVSEKQTVESPDDPQSLIEFSAIPGTKKELAKIVRDEKNPQDEGIFQGERFLDAEFTKQNFAKTLGNKNKFSVVHIASHFQLGSNWSNSFLLLGNGQILTLKEMINSPDLDFTGTELVTLSACDTASVANSNGKEVDSLANVIQAKNGKAVLAALWEVVDESTPLLMSEFYSLRKENPQMTKAEAIQKVQRDFVKGKIKPTNDYTEKLAQFYDSQSKAGSYKFDKNAPFAHPYFWSPFVLIGNWR